MSTTWSSRAGTARRDSRQASCPRRSSSPEVRSRSSSIPRTGLSSVADSRTGQTWSQKPAGASLLVKDARASTEAIEADLVDPRTALEFTTRLRFDTDRPEIAVELSGKGELGHSLAFPHPFVTGKGTFLVMPVNEGMSYPVDDPSLPPMHYILYGGHGLCMPWWGVTDGRKGLMAIVETPDDASISVPRVDGLLCQSPALGRAEGPVRPAAADPLRLLRRRRLRRDGQAIPQVRPGARAVQDPGAEAGREPERRPAHRCGQRLVLGPRRRRDRWRAANGRASSESSGRTACRRIRSGSSTRWAS